MKADNQTSRTSEAEMFGEMVALLKRCQSWPRLSEQFPAEDKWISAGLRSLRGPGLGCEAGRAEPDRRRTKKTRLREFYAAVAVGDRLK